MDQRFCSLTAVCAIAFNSVSNAAEPFVEVVAPVLRERCVMCHGEGGESEADVDLLSFAGAGNVNADAELLKDLILVIDEGLMPPKSEEPLSDEERLHLTSALRETLHAALADGRHQPRTPIRRMNRFQYANAVQDLFDLNVKVFSLPEQMLREHGGYFDPASGEMPETLKAGSRPLGKSQLIEPRLAGVAAFPQDLRAEHGFDNRGDHLSLSPLLMESFLKLSQSIVESPDFHAKTCSLWDQFFAAPEESDVESVVAERLRTFLSRAFRRSIDEPTLERYVDHVVSRVGAGDSFTDSMKAAASAAIASPRFLYLYDGASRADTVTTIDDFELASRLSFFLWGSLPDQTLLDLADAGSLTEPEVLSEQVDRMLNDRRVKRFCDSFPSQWLQLDRIISSVPDPETYPGFYFSRYRASMHMMLEPLLLFETLLVEDRSILELIDSDYSYRSALLDSWYKDGKKAGAGPPTAITFKRVPLEDRRQGGVITTAAVMTMTSGPERTKPITRGAWIASVILNNAPKPPPADVPPLSEEEADVENLTLRERLDLHRERADCAGCHAQIDPLGFAFENFGPTGEWRETYDNGLSIEPQGVLFRRHEFADVIDFKNAILKEKDRFTQGFAGHLLSFALGRELTAADWPSLDVIVEETKETDYRLRPMIKAVVMSEAFQQKSNPSESMAHAD